MQTSWIVGLGRLPQYKQKNRAPKPAARRVYKSSLTFAGF
jgi:hypothetical protein